MPDYSMLPEELWEEILFAVIDIPYALDTLLPLEGFFWRDQQKYHDESVYGTSEQQRKALRPVCRRWRNWPDLQRFRWISYNTDILEDAPKQDEAIRALCHEGREPADASMRNLSRPRRVEFWLHDGRDHLVYKAMIQYRLYSVTTLFLHYGINFEDLAFEFLIGHYADLPNLRCLRIPVPPQDVRPYPLVDLAGAFPYLRSLSVAPSKTGLTFARSKGEANVVLRDMEDLDLDIVAYTHESLATWEVPSLKHLHIPLDLQSEGVGEERFNMLLTFMPAKIFGANLTLLNFAFADMALEAPVRIPNEFWEWLPRLEELWTSFSLLLWPKPAPSHHPLRYGAHYSDPRWDFTRSSTVDTSATQAPYTLIHNLQMLPPSFESLAFPEQWENQWRSMVGSITGRVVEILNDLMRVSKEKGIRVQDYKGIELHSFLGTADRE